MDFAEALFDRLSGFVTRSWYILRSEDVYDEGTSESFDLSGGFT